MHMQDCSAFDVFGRIMSGTVKPGDRVRVLGEAYTPDDEEDSVVSEVTAVWAYQARYRVPLNRAIAGAGPSPPLHCCIRCTLPHCSNIADCLQCITQSMSLWYRASPPPLTSDSFLALGSGRVRQDQQRGLFRCLPLLGLWHVSLHSPWSADLKRSDMH